MLRRSRGQAVSFEELRDAGLEYPASVVEELELAGVPVERCHRVGPDSMPLAGVRLRAEHAQPRSGPARRDEQSPAAHASAALGHAGAALGHLIAAVVAALGDLIAALAAARASRAEKPSALSSPLAALRERGGQASHALARRADIVARGAIANREARRELAARAQTVARGAASRGGHAWRAVSTAAIAAGRAARDGGARRALDGLAKIVARGAILVGEAWRTLARQPNIVVRAAVALPLIAAIVLAALAAAQLARTGPRRARHVATPTHVRRRAARASSTGKPAGGAPRQATGTSSTRGTPTQVSPALAAQLQARGHELLQMGQLEGAVLVLQHALAASGENVGSCSEPVSETCITYAYALYDLGTALRLDHQPAAAVLVLEHRLEIDNQRAAVQSELELARQDAALHSRSR